MGDRNDCEYHAVSQSEYATNTVTRLATLAIVSCLCLHVAECSRLHTLARGLSDLAFRGIIRWGFTGQKKYSIKICAHRVETIIMSWLRQFLALGVAISQS
jgi:hypothetical protein